MVRTEDRRSHASIPWTDASTRRAIRRLALTLTFAGLGLASANLGSANWPSALSAGNIAHSPIYNVAISSLLAIGLFASTFGISRAELKRNARTVVAAITLGVVVKAGLTGVVMLLVYSNPAYLILGVAVAQIDPLSVASMLKYRAMSERAKAILSAWASFDDPITVLLVLYLAPFALPAARAHTGSGSAFAGQGSLPAYLMHLGLNLVLIAVAAAIWLCLREIRRRWPGKVSLVHGLACAFLVLMLIAAIKFGLLLGFTVCGLFFRPPVARVMSWIVPMAFYSATFLLGIFLVGGANVLAGILLGATAFGVQILAGRVIGRRLSRQDQMHIALGQQNGITAIVLALALDPYFPQAVGIIAVAVLVVNVVNVVANGIWDRLTAVKAACRPRASRDQTDTPAPVANPGLSVIGGRVGDRGTGSRTD